ncbi:hypothetical protein A6R68_20531 [Neotoma lepida]|uniref:Uncharacterized protein n=1 Tax=Neotoma lepida TaxID=56216 RepID=A0A1A6HSM9_NEOLE|nr:hypothetical protein A6R68_20531 [Neotoma lepida]
MEHSVSVDGIQSMQLSAAVWLALSQPSSLTSFVRVSKHPGQSSSWCVLKPQKRYALEYEEEASGSPYHIDIDSLFSQERMLTRQRAINLQTQKCGQRWSSSISCCCRISRSSISSFTLYRNNFTQDYPQEPQKIHISKRDFTKFHADEFEDMQVIYLTLHEDTQTAASLMPQNSSKDEWFNYNVYNMLCKISTIERLKVMTKIKLSEHTASSSHSSLLQLELHPQHFLV